MNPLNRDDSEATTTSSSRLDQTFNNFMHIVKNISAWWYYIFTVWKIIWWSVYYNSYQKREGEKQHRQWKRPELFSEE